MECLHFKSRLKEENCCPWCKWLGRAPEDTWPHRSVWTVRCYCQACLGGTYFAIEFKILQPKWKVFTFDPLATVTLGQSRGYNKVKCSDGLWSGRKILAAIERWLSRKQPALNFKIASHWHGLKTPRNL